MTGETTTLGGGVREVLFYSLTDGTFSGRGRTGTDESIAAKTPVGYGAIDAAMVRDWQSQRVDLATGDVIDWQPPAPSDTYLATWSWDPEIRRWIAQPTIEARWREVRAERDLRLAASDWVALRGLERGEPVPKAWRDYRQSLRDVPKQLDPTAIDWPEPPAA